MSRAAEKAAAGKLVLVPTEKEIKLPHHQLHVTEELLVTLYDFEQHAVHL